MTRFGRSAGFPASARRFCQRRFSASPPSIAASLEPVVEHQVAWSASGAFQRRLSVLTQRISSSAVCGVLVLVDHVLVEALGHELRCRGMCSLLRKTAAVSRSPYQLTPNPSPFVSSAPICECTLWTTREFLGP